MMFRNTRAIVCSAVSLFFTVTLFAQQEDVDEVGSSPIQKLLEKAETGDARAQGLIARHYNGGNIILGYSHEEALKWARLSMDQEHPFGIFMMGFLIRSGDAAAEKSTDVNVLFERARPGLKALAQGGDPDAQSMLGIMYEKGFGSLDVNQNEAIKWFTLAAEQDNGWGAYNLAVVMAESAAGGQQLDKQIALAKSAVAKGGLSAHVHLARLYSQMESREYAVKAMELCRVAAEKGSPIAQNNLGYALLSGNGVHRDYEAALELFRKAGKKGVARAKSNLEWFRKYSSLPLPLHETRGTNKDSLPVLSFGEAVFAGSAYREYPEVCFHDRVITELLQRYQCLVAYRSMPYSFPAEDVLRTPVKRENVFPAHIMASSLYVLQDERARKGFGGHVWSYALSTVNYSREIRDIIKPYSVDDVARAIADALAYRMHAKPKRETEPRPADVSGWKIAVAPLTKMNSAERKKEIVANHGRYFVPLKAALEARAGEESASLHLDIDLETARDAFTGIVSWAMSRHGKDRWIIDMHLLDPKTLLYVATASIIVDGNKPEHIDYDELVKRLFADVNAEVPVMNNEVPLLDREAEMFVRYANSTKLVGSFTLPERLPDYGTSWTRYLAVKACERSYLLNSGDAVKSYMALWAMSNVLYLNTDKKSVFGGADHFSDEAAVLMSQILKTRNLDWQALAPDDFRGYSFSPNVIIPDVYEAEVLVYRKKFHEAIAVAAEALKKHPAEERLVVALATALIAEKRDSEAMSAIQDFKKEYGGSPRMAKAEIDLGAATGDDRMLYEALKAQAVGARSMSDANDWAAFLELMPRFEGPEEAIDILSEWISKNKRLVKFPISAHLGARLRQAECYEMLDDKEAAIRRARDVVATARGGAEARHYRRKARALIGKLAKETGRVEDLWKTPADLGVDTSEYKIYLAAAGENVPAEVMKATVDNLSKFLGIKCEVLPAVNEAEPGRGNTHGFFRRLYSRYGVPSDALMLGFIARYRLSGSRISSSADGNPAFQGTPDYYKFDNERIVRIYSEAMAANFASSLRYSYTTNVRNEDKYFPFNKEKCPNDPCMFADYPGSWGSHMRFSICEKCQAEFKGLDFSEINAQLIRHLRDMGATIVEK